MAAPSGRASHRAPNSLKQLVNKIRLHSSDELENVLQEVQSLVRKSKGLDIVGEFRKLGGLDEVVKIVKSDCEEKFADLALSVLATCCREEQSRLRVHQLEGISTLVDILNTHTSVSVINRASRALANLAETPKLSAAIHNKDAAPLLIKLLKENKDSNCRQSILRTIRMLADTCQHSWDILHSEGLLAVLNCLDSEDDKLVGNAAHTAAQLTSNLGSGRSTEALKSYLEAGKQAVEGNGVGHLVGLLSQSKASIQENALMTILNLMVSEDVRVAAGKADAVKIFIERGNKKSMLSSWATYVHCLCFCCREAVNRVRVRDLEGFQVLLSVLKNSSEDCRRLHETVLVALMDFYYDEQSLNYLAACGLIPILVSQLRLEETCPTRKSVCSSDSKSPREASTEPDFTDKKPSISCKIKEEKLQTKPLKVGGRTKRVRSLSVDADKVTYTSKQSSSLQSLSTGSKRSSIDTSLPAAKKARLTSHQKTAQAVKSSAESLEPSVSHARSRHDKKSVPTVKVEANLQIPPRPSSTSGMSPEGHSTNYQSYLSLEATPYSPPRIDWEWFLQHREQMGQDLSPRSFSSYSSPLSLSPPSRDFSPSSSPQWSPQWSPEQSPQHPSNWSSPQHSITWSPHYTPQWSPVHSPQWELSVPDDCDVLSELASDIELPVNEESTKPVLCPNQEKRQKRNEIDVLLPTAKQLSEGLSSEVAQSAGGNSKSPNVKQPKNTLTTVTKTIVKPTNVEAFNISSVDDDGNELSGKVSIKSNTATSDGYSPFDKNRKNFAHAGSSQDERSKNSVDAGEESGKFREPSSASMKMRTGKSRTTSVSRQTPETLPLEKLESDTDLLPFLESKKPKESMAAKFERDMEIRRAKEEGKLRRREYAVVTLLSRYSHMEDPSTHMAKASVIQVLMDYHPTSVYLQFKSRRTLQRILRNRLCFEKLILEHVPMLIAREVRSRENKAKLTKYGEDGTLEGHKYMTRIKRSLSADGVSSLKAKRHSGNDSPQLMQNQSLAGDSTDLFEDSMSDTTSECSTDIMELSKTKRFGDAASLLDVLMVSTSQYRQGILIHLLMLESVNGKLACIFAVPHICQSRSLKTRLLIKHKGLEILTDYLQKGNEVPDMFTKAVQCLLDLSSSLFKKKEEAGPTSKVPVRFSGSSDPEACSWGNADVQKDYPPYGESKREVKDSSACGVISEASSIKEQLEMDQRPSKDCFDKPSLPNKNVCCVEAAKQKPDVKFLLDQDIVIEAHRDILARHSEYFKCLLEGPFLESSQSVVPIKKISQEPFVMMLHTLHGCRLGQCRRMKDAIAKNSSSLQEAIACSGRFLLRSVQNQLCDILIEDFLDASNVVSHYLFGLKHDCSRLTTACLMHLLTNTRVSENHFQKLVDRGCSKNAFRSIKQLITDALLFSESPYLHHNYTINKRTLKGDLFLYR